MHSIALWPSVVVLVVATVTDLRSRRIPNWLVLPFLVVGMAVSAWILGWSGLEKSLEGMGLALLLFGVLAVMGGMGMGDVKLCAALGAWIGPHQMFLALVLTGMMGGLMAIVWAAFGGFLGELFTNSSDVLFGWTKRGMRGNPDLTLKNPRARKMPYAPAIAVGTLLSFLAR
ncbi:MAG: prepilin peptidase [Acidobacteriota bacterium]|nr:prepilin peptidase [Acidobacteriota bacterium]